MQNTKDYYEGGSKYGASEYLKDKGIDKKHFPNSFYLEPNEDILAC